MVAICDREIVTEAGTFCFYCDTPDGDFLIDRVPGHPALFVASGGSGHAFKFAPVLGDIIADVVEGNLERQTARFRWRAARTGREAARGRSPSTS